jgi:F0F1-type ATP synthase epsilon subunit
MSKDDTTTFKFTLRTPETDLYDGMVHAVSFTSEGGDAQLFAHHASFTSSVLFSTVRVDEGNGVTKEFAARSGLFLFNNVKNEAVLLALHATEKAEISVQTAKEYLAFIEKQMEAGADMSDFQLKHLEGEKFAVEQQLEMMGTKE